MSLIKILAHADNDVNSDSQAVNAAMVSENADLYCFIGDGPYSDSGTAWVAQQKKHFDDKKDKMMWSRGNHDEDESESKQTQKDMESWFPEAKGVGISDCWLSSRQVGNVFVISQDTQDLDIEFKRDQYNWVAGELTKAKQLRASGQVDWIVILFHKPAFTLKSSHSPYTALRFLYKDIWHDAQVDFCISGHNHNTQLWYPMVPDQSQANGEGKQLFTYASDGKTFDFTKEHGPAYIVTGHSAHEWNKISDSGSGVKNVMHHRSSGKFGYTALEFDGKKAKVLSKDVDKNVVFEYNITREGETIPEPCKDNECKDPVTNQCRSIASDEVKDSNGFCKKKDEPDPTTKIDQTKALNFIKNSYKPNVGMLEEAPGFAQYWLWNDQLLGQIALKSIDAQLAKTIENKMNSYGVTMKTPWATLDPKYRNNFSVKIATEPTISTNPSIRYSDYGGNSDLSVNTHADIAFLSAIHYFYTGNQTLSKQAYDAGKKMWDGQGMKDAGNITGEYAIYKVALGLLAQKITGYEPIGIPENYFVKFQNSNGGITTDLTNGQPSGSQNVETTAAVLFATNPELLKKDGGPDPDPDPTDVKCPDDYEFDPSLNHCIPLIEPKETPNCGEGYTWNPVTKVCDKDGGGPDPEPGNPIAKLDLPTKAEPKQAGIVADASASTADTVEITETTSQGIQLVDTGERWKKKFNIPDKNNFSIGIQAIAKKGTKTSVVQKSIQVSSTGGPDPDPNGEIDEHGIKWLVAKGKKTIVEMSRDEATDDRWSGNVTGLMNGFEATFIGKSSDTSGDAHFAMKQFSGNHSGSGADKNAWYDTGLRQDGTIQLQTEYPHPKNHDFTLSDSEQFIKKISKDLEGNWIGLKWCVVLVKPGGTRKDGIRLRMWVDEDPIDTATGKPKNNWKIVYDFIDTGQVIPADKQLVDEQDCEVRRSDTGKHDIYGDGKIIENATEGAPGLHVRPLA